MEIRSNKVGDVTIVQLIGELTAQSTGQPQEHLLRLVEPGAKIILNMTGVSFMSSAGLRMLLILYRTIRNRGGNALLVGLSEDLQNTMSLTGFLELFQHHDTLEAGLGSMQKVV